MHTNIELKPSDMPREVVAALEHVQAFRPYACMVVVDLFGRWLFMDSGRQQVSFAGTEIDVGILEEMVDALDNACHPLPALFYRGVPGKQFCRFCGTLIDPDGCEPEEWGDTKPCNACPKS